MHSVPLIASAALRGQLCRFALPGHRTGAASAPGRCGESLDLAHPDDLATSVLSLAESVSYLRKGGDSCLDSRGGLANAKHGLKTQQ